MTRTTLTVPVDHPCLADHFPGRPVVPAVVIIEAVLARAAAAGHAVAGVSSARFRRPLAPGEPCTLVLTARRGQLQFRLTTAAGDPVARGELACG